MDANSTEVAGLKVLKAIAWVVYAIAVFASIIIAFAFFLLFFNASTKAPFVQFVYDWGVVFSKPFAGMIEPSKVSATGGLISWSALFAIAAYLVAAWAIGFVLSAISRGIYRKSRPSAMPAPAPVAAAPAAAPAPTAPPAAQPAAPAPAEHVEPAPPA
jgi:uncharacterized protein YggT (Ycf19 family)